MSDTSAQEIGGYFGLELPAGGHALYNGARRFQSARAAFLALLRARKPNRVFLPRYICDAMLQPLQIERIECIWYELDADLMVARNVQLAEGDLLVYVNYFGLLGKNVLELLRRFQPSQLVFDYSQSFHELPVDNALATIYSPRKFFGIPDGGLLVSSCPEVGEPVKRVNPIPNLTHLLKRSSGYLAEEGYADYQRAERAFMDCEPQRMSVLSERILTSVNLGDVVEARRENFLYLHESLGRYNLFEIDETDVGAPLCYPFMVKDSSIRDHLIMNRVFVPVYWSDALSRVQGGIEEKLVKNLMPLPIDQRYTTQDMQRVVSILEERVR